MSLQRSENAEVTLIVSATPVIGMDLVEAIQYWSRIWTPEEKNAIQRLWWCHPDYPEQPALATEYRDTLELPQFDEAPRLP